MVDEDEFTAILTLLEGDDDEDDEVSPKEVGHNIYILAHEASTLIYSYLYSTSIYF